MSLRSRLAGLIDPRSQTRSQIVTRFPSNLQIPARGLASVVAAVPQTSLGVPAVYGAVRMISSAVSTLDWSALLRSTELAVDPQPSIIRRPDPDQPVELTKQQLISSLLLQGEAFLWLTAPGRDQRPTIGVPIPNDRVTITWNSNQTRPIYRVGDQVVSPRRDLLHLKYLAVTGELHGLGPIQLARVSVSGSLAAETMAQTQWTEGGPPIDGVVTVPGKLTKDEADIHREQWSTRALARGPAFLSGGMEFQAVQMSNADLQFLESRNYGVLDVCRLFGIPPKFLAAELGGSSLSYANNQEAYVDLVRGAYQPVADILEIGFGELIPTTQVVRTSFAPLLRADIRTRFDTYAIARQNELLTANEIRQLEGLQAIPGADVLSSPDETGTETTTQEVETV